jgi:RHS repeat-associated protein
MNSFPQPSTPSSAYTAVYDAWNRMVSISDTGGTVATYQYDGRNRRTVKVTTATSETRHFYWTSNWQDIEERVGTATTMDKQYAWGIRYVDELVCRDDTTERIYACQDANFNLTAACNTSGSVVERYLFDPYGNRTIMNASWSVLSDSAYDWVIGFQGLMHDVESGLVYDRGRILNPPLGRMNQRDSVRAYREGLSLYQFENSDPVKFLDASGWEATSSCTCGPDVTVELLQIRQQVMRQIAGLNQSQERQLKNDLLNPFTADRAWDIAQFPSDSAYSPKCGTGTGNCAGTVTIYNTCYDQGAANYWLIGVIVQAAENTFGWPDEGDYELYWQGLLTRNPWTKSGEMKTAFMYAGAHGDLQDPRLSAAANPYQGCTVCHEAALHLGWHWGLSNGLNIGGSVS